jgi:hypothetical protein
MNDNFNKVDFKGSQDFLNEFSNSLKVCNT